MKTSHKIASVAAGGLLAVGGIGFAASQASADETPSPSDPSASSSASSGTDTAGKGRHGHGQRGDKNQMAANLATQLGVDEAKVTTALEEIRSEQRAEREAADDSTTRPSASERSDALATDLADKLGVEKQAVLDALDKIQTTQNTERAAQMQERLDTAVSDGTLTQAEADGVTKAVEKGVIGGRGR